MVVMMVMVVRKERDWHGRSFRQGGSGSVGSGWLIQRGRFGSGVPSSPGVAASLAGAGGRGKLVGVR